MSDVEAFPGGSVVKNPPVNAGEAEDADLILGLGRSPREKNGYPLQYSCLENPMDGGAWWATVLISKRMTSRSQLGSHPRPPIPS